VAGSRYGLAIDPVEFFRIAFNADPVSVWTGAASRSVLLGHHSDYCDGLALSIAFGPRVSIAFSPRADDRVVIRNVAEPAAQIDVDLDTVIRNEYGTWTDGLDDLGLGRWPRQVLCVPAIMRYLGTFAGGANIVVARAETAGPDTFDFESPITSAATAVFAGIYGFESGLAANPKRMGDLAAQGEREFLFTGGGAIDHLTTLVARADAALLLDWGRAEGVVAPYTWSPEYAPLDLAAAGLSLVAVRGIRPAGTDLYEKQGEWRDVCRYQAAKLGKQRLREFTSEQFAQLAPQLQEDTRIATHTFAENARVERAAALLRAGDDPRAGTVDDRVPSIAARRSRPQPAGRGTDRQCRPQRRRARRPDQRRRHGRLGAGAHGVHCRGAGRAGDRPSGAAGGRFLVGAIGATLGRPGGSLRLTGGGVAAEELAILAG
jgi:galactokinase